MSTESIRNIALQYLARREYSQWELRKKLIAKNYFTDQVDAVLCLLADAQLQSDQRFVEAYVSSRVNKGFGPRHIIVVLHHHQISDTLITKHVSDNHSEWWERLILAWKKKYAWMSAAQLKKTHAKQIYFLIQRGFESESVYRWIKYVTKELMPDETVTEQSNSR